MSQVKVAIAVVEHDESFLVGRRPEGKPLAGYWEFPGGRIEPGESPREAAVRECREETGIHVTVVRELPDQVEEYDHGTVHLRFFECRPTDGSLKPLSPFRWVPRSKLGGYSFPAGNDALLALLLGGCSS